MSWNGGLAVSCKITFVVDTSLLLLWSRTRGGEKRSAVNVLFFSSSLAKQVFLRLKHDWCGIRDLDFKGTLPQKLIDALFHDARYPN